MSAESVTTRAVGDGRADALRGTIGSATFPTVRPGFAGCTDLEHPERHDARYL
jgi:hypothetical protein